MVNELHPGTTENVPFWMDTTCVPRGDQYVDARMKVIEMIHRIYAEADKVLVLDATITRESADASLE